MRNLKFLVLAFAIMFILQSCQKDLLDYSVSEDISTKGYTPSSDATTYNLSDWMKFIPDDTEITKLSIPGTHESAARVDAPIIGSLNSGTNIAKCQDLSISDQLEMGVRFLDIRARHIDNTFTIHHDRIFQNLYFDDVLKDCYDFLDKHPSETIIMSVKEEYEAEKTSQSFETTFKEFVEKNPAKWDLGSGIPKLKDLRGKIKLINRFTKSDGFGIDATQWSDNATFSIKTSSPILKIQDKYVITSQETKWNEVKLLLEESARNTSNAIYINFGSGYNLSLGGTKAGSNYVNPKIKEYLKKGTRGTYGIIALDFINSDLTQAIIETNYGYNVQRNDGYNDGWNLNRLYPISDNKNQNYDIYLPAGRSKEKTNLFIFIHGGSFTGGDKTGGETKDSFEPLMQAFPDCALATINYRIGVDISMDQHNEDVENAIKEIVKNCEAMNISSSQIVLAGESAGAYLAFFAGLKDSNYKEKIKAIVSYSGFAEMLPEGSPLNNALVVKLPREEYYYDFKPIFFIPWTITGSVKLEFKQQYKYSPKDWIASRTDLPEIYLFAGKKDDQISINCSQRIYDEVQKNGNPSIKSKVFKEIYDDEGHTMSPQTKKDIAAVLKSKILF